MKKFKVVAAIILLIVLLIGLYKLTHKGFEVVGTATYTVSYGDTLWGIAKSQIGNSVDARQYIDLIKKYNDGLTPDLKVGQEIILPILNISKQEIKLAHPVSACEIKSREPKLTVKYTSLGVPSINSSFKTWMSYKAITKKSSPQYKFTRTWGWSDAEGFMRCSGERDLGIEQDYYLIALGSYYGDKIGTKYRITLDTGKVFYGALADCKNNRHTNSTNQYVQKNGNVVEFLVDTSKLNKDVKRMGNANIYTPLKGDIVKIERMDFVLE